jgi:hypothetical protein
MGTLLQLRQLIEQQVTVWAGFNVGICGKNGYKLSYFVLERLFGSSTCNTG